MSVPNEHASIIMYVNIVPPFLIAFFMVLGDMYRGGLLSEPLVQHFTTWVLGVIMGNAITWIPAAHYLGKFLERRERRKKRERRKRL